MSEFQMLHPDVWSQVLQNEAPWHLDRAKRFCWEWLKEGSLADRLAVDREQFEAVLAAEFLSLERALIGEEAFRRHYGEEDN